MWQIRLGVFVKKSLTTFIYDISKTKEATGALLCYYFFAFVDLWTDFL
jgi:hypothetical protein